MSIVLNEYEWAERMINNHDLGKRPVETLNRVAKYYLTTGYSKREIRRMLDTFLVQCDPSASLPSWSDVLDKIAKNVDRRPIIQMDGIDVTVKEMEAIEKLEGKQLRRLAFTLLCVAKYWDAVSERNDHWVNTSDREIMQMANIRPSIRQQSNMFAELKARGMIQFSKKIDNLNVKALFIEDGETAIHIHDFRNLGYQYLKYYGAPYFECVNCGLVVKNKGHGHKYCLDCATEMRIKKSVESVMRQRWQPKNKTV